MQLFEAFYVLEVNGFHFGYLVIGVVPAIHDAQSAYQLLASLAEVTTFFSAVNLNTRRSVR